MKANAWLWILAFVMVAGCGSTPSSLEVARQAAVGKVDVCHVPDGASAGNIITIAEPAYDSHIAHGDPAVYVVNPDGTCEEGCAEQGQPCNPASAHPCCLATAECSVICRVP